MKRFALTVLTTATLTSCADGGGGQLLETRDAAVPDGTLGSGSDSSERSTSTSASNATSTSGSASSASSSSTLTNGQSSFSGTASSGASTGSGSFSGTSTSGGEDSTSNESSTSTATTDGSTVGQTTSDRTSTSSSSASSSSDSSSSSSSSSDAPARQSEFDIELIFLDTSEASKEVADAFRRAEEFWEELIVGDLPDVTTRRQACNGPDIYVEGTIDDLQIFVAVGKMDGPDGILGAAGPCLGRPSFQGGLPLAGFMQFDSEDLERYAANGRLDEIIIHEMGHVLGFGGVMWQQQGFLADASSPNAARDTHFTGEKAIAAFNAIGGNAYMDAKVPVENTGGEGTANGHWREGVMGNEMMTSYMTNMKGVLSTVTLAALEDMGYEVDYSKAGNYVWPPPNERPGRFALKAESDFEPIDLNNDILDIPYVTID